jgi:myo-inositol-1(or 4)-monophosphatase
MHPVLNIAVKAARRAGSVINRSSFDLDKLTIEQKAQNDFVSEVDRAAEQAIIQVLKEAYPQHSILAEESGLIDNKSEYQWIIDPLDGTTNFLHGFPQYCVSIALAVKGVVQHGVIFDPVRNDLFTTSRGGGAFLNDRRIRVSKTLLLKDALLGTGFPYREFAHMDQFLASLKEMTLKAAGIRRPGAAALDMAYVACGRFDGFWEFGLKPWDVAAGGLLVQEAGGLISDYSGESDWLFGGSVVCGTPRVFAPMLAIIQAHEKK